MATTSAVDDIKTAGTLTTTTQIIRKPLWRRMWKSRLSYIMLLPFFIPFIIFAVIPMVSSIVLSLTDYSGVRTQEINFIGLDNFTDLLSIEIKHLPRMVDENTGESLFLCGRDRVVESEVSAIEADGASCTPAYVRSRDVLSEGYREYETILQSDSGAYVIGATDPRFWKAMYNTVVYTVVTVAIRLLAGLGLALALQRQSVANMFLRVLFFLPSVTSGIAITVVWGYLFRGQSFGLINSLRLEMGFDIIEFLGDPSWTLPIVMLLTIWGGMGYNMILFLAGLQNIPAELYEAATVDGASTWHKFRFITLPLLRPTTLFILVTSIIGSFQVFDVIYILFATAEGVGGVLDSALTIVPYLYERGFTLFQMGSASAIAWVLFIIIFILTLINLRVGQANEA